MFWSELKILLHKNSNKCFNFHISEELVLFGTTTNCTTDKSLEFIILLAIMLIKLGSMPVLSEFQTILNYFKIQI